VIKMQPRIEEELNKIGDLSINGITEITLSEAIKNDRKNISDLTTKETNDISNITLLLQQYVRDQRRGSITEEYIVKDGQLLMDGSLKKRTDYPDLWNWVNSHGLAVTEVNWANNKGLYSSGEEVQLLDCQIG
jgi:hypothetical protein